MLVRCSAKINLYLNVIRRREDGYHEIETVFQPVSLWDEITLTPIPGGIELIGDVPSIAWDASNLCHIAARTIFEKTGCMRGVRIEVKKGIPAGAGLGGGSSDAAGVLLGLNSLMGFKLPEDELRSLALGIGSDVPFFVMGNPAVGSGRGEILERFAGLKRGYILLVKPDIEVSTAWAYANLKLLLTKNVCGTTLESLVRGIAHFPGVKLNSYNSFEEPLVERFPEIGELLEKLECEGAALCMVSGSGSACFALFDKEKSAREAGDRLRRKGLFTSVARPVRQAITFLHQEYNNRSGGVEWR